MVHVDPDMLGAEQFVEQRQPLWQPLENPSE